MTGALHPFLVIHHDTVTPYNPQDFRERVTETPKFSSKPRIPAEILHLLDRAMSDLRDLGLDSDSFHQAAKEALEDIYEETAELEFWDNEKSITELDTLQRTRYKQFFVK